jgi:glycosyltransferase involved in cell wall biosynthesis
LVTERLAKSVARKAEKEADRDRSCQPDLIIKMPRPVRPYYFAFLGRITPEKGVDRAICIAQRCGVPLKISAKVDKVDREYFDLLIHPLIRAANVEYIGEISDKEKSEFLSGAIALLVPIEWPEPFGLVMIEAMACGTPIIAFNRGSVPEIVDEGLTGFIVEDETGVVGAVDRLQHLSGPATTDLENGLFLNPPMPFPAKPATAYPGDEDAPARSKRGPQCASPMLPRRIDGEAGRLKRAVNAGDLVRGA